MPAVLGIGEGDAQRDSQPTADTTHNSQGLDAGKVHLAPTEKVLSLCRGHDCQGDWLRQPTAPAANVPMTGTVNSKKESGGKQ